MLGTKVEPINENENINTNPIVPFTTSERSLEVIYEAYPLKVGKKPALKAIEKAVRKYGDQFVLDKTKAFAKARNGDVRYCPNPATWFNAERFNDPAETWIPRPEAPSHLVARLKAAEEMFEKHPCNPASKNHVENASQELRDGYNSLKSIIEKLKVELAQST